MNCCICRLAECCWTKYSRNEQSSWWFQSSEKDHRTLSTVLSLHMTVHNSRSKTGETRVFDTSWLLPLRYEVHPYIKSPNFLIRRFLLCEFWLGALHVQALETKLCRSSKMHEGWDRSELNHAPHGAVITWALRVTQSRMQSALNNDTQHTNWPQEQQATQHAWRTSSEHPGMSGNSISYFGVHYMIVMLDLPQESLRKLWQTHGRRVDSALDGRWPWASPSTSCGSFRGLFHNHIRRSVYIYIYIYIYIYSDIRISDSSDCPCFGSSEGSRNQGGGCLVLLSWRGRTRTKGLRAHLHKSAFLKVERELAYRMSRLHASKNSQWLSGHVGRFL